MVKLRSVTWGKRNMLKQWRLVPGIHDLWTNWYEKSCRNIVQPVMQSLWKATMSKSWLIFGIRFDWRKEKVGISYLVSSPGHLGHFWCWHSKHASYISSMKGPASSKTFLRVRHAQQYQTFVPWVFFRASAEFFCASGERSMVISPGPFEAGFNKGLPLSHGRSMIEAGAA